MNGFSVGDVVAKVGITAMIIGFVTVFVFGVSLGSIGLVGGLFIAVLGLLVMMWTV